MRNKIEATHQFSRSRGDVMINLNIILVFSRIALILYYG